MPKFQREEVRLDKYGDPDYLFLFYEALASSDEEAMKKLEIPHSSVFYVREAIEAKTGVRYSLKHVEQAMIAEGYLEKEEEKENGQIPRMATK